MRPSSDRSDNRTLSSRSQEAPRCSYPLKARTIPTRAVCRLASNSAKAQAYFLTVRPGVALDHSLWLKHTAHKADVLVDETLVLVAAVINTLKTWPAVRSTKGPFKHAHLYRKLLYVIALPNAMVLTDDGRQPDIDDDRETARHIVAKRCGRLAREFRTARTAHGALDQAMTTRLDASGRNHAKVFSETVPVCLLRYDTNSNNGYATVSNQERHITTTHR